jgi:hypothetical protein
MMEEAKRANSEEKKQDDENVVGTGRADEFAGLPGAR